MDALLSKASSKTDSAASKSLGKKLVEGLGAKKDKVEKETNRRDRYNVFCNELKGCNNIRKIIPIVRMLTYLSYLQ